MFQLLGITSFDKLTGGIIYTVGHLFLNVMRAIWYYICYGVYALVIVVFKVVDFLSDLFRCFAGLDLRESSTTGMESKGDLIIHFVSNGDIVSVFSSICALAAVLLIIVTIIQVIRVEYTTEGANNSKNEILRKTGKAIVLFVTVPVASMFGIMASNYLLGAVDAATSGERFSFSEKIFEIGAFNANPYKLKMENNKDSQSGGGEDSSENNENSYFKFVPKNIKWTSEYKESEHYGDNCEYVTFFEGEDPSGAGHKGDFANPYVELNDEFLRNEFLANGWHKDIKAVVYYFDVTKFFMMGFFLIFVFGWVSMKTLFTAIVGLIIRIYNCVILFIISPPVVALFPLDEGAAYKNWRQRFMGSILGAYGTVVGLNLFFIIAKVIWETEILEFFENDFYNLVVKALFTLVGLLTIKNMSKLVSGIIGADDILESGEGTAKQITDSAKKVAVGAGTLAVGGLALGAGMTGGIASRVSSNRAQGKDKKADSLNEKIAASSGKKKDMESSAQKSAMEELGYGGDYGSLSADQKKLVDNNVSSRLTENKEYQSLSSSISSDISDRDELGTKSQRMKARAVKGHVASSRLRKTGTQSSLGVLQQSGFGKTANQVTGGMFKTLGGKGFDQYDGMIMDGSDTEKKIFEVHQSMRKDKKEAKHDKRLGSMTSAYTDEYDKQIVQNMVTGQIANIKNMSVESQGSMKSNVDNFQGRLTLGQELLSKGIKLDSDFMKEAFEMANQHKNTTGDNALLEAVNKMADINNNKESAKEKANAMGGIDVKSAYNQTTYITQNVSSNTQSIEKLKEAMASNNTKAAKEYMRLLQESLRTGVGADGKGAFDIKNLDQISDEIMNLAKAEKISEKKLTKLVQQMGKLTGK